MRKLLLSLSLLSLLTLGEDRREGIQFLRLPIYVERVKKDKEKPEPGTLIEKREYEINLKELDLGDGNGKIVVHSTAPPYSKDEYPTNNWLNHHYEIFNNNSKSLYQVCDAGPRIHAMMELKLIDNLPALVFVYNGLKNSNNDWLPKENIDDCVHLSRPGIDPASIVFASYNRDESVVLKTSEMVSLEYLCNGYNVPGLSIRRKNTNVRKLDLKRVHTTCTVCHGR